MVYLQTEFLSIHEQPIAGIFCGVIFSCTAGRYRCITDLLHGLNFHETWASYKPVGNTRGCVLLHLFAG